MFVFREEVYRQDESNRGVAEILVRKQRNGPTGEVALTFLDRYTRFEDASDRRVDSPL
jgi:replicative DNA helicase